MRPVLFSLIVGVIAYLLYTAAPQIQRAVTVLGVFRRYPEGALVKEAVTVIPDTTHCEDLHHHLPSGYLFTACEDDPQVRFKWFPPLVNFDSPELARKSRGSIHVIDSKACSSTDLLIILSKHLAISNWSINRRLLLSASLSKTLTAHSSHMESM